MPEPTIFLDRKFPIVSIVCPTNTEGAAMGALKFLPDIGLFIGQSNDFFATMTQLAQAADAATRFATTAPSDGTPAGDGDGTTETIILTATPLETCGHDKPSCGRLLREKSAAAHNRTGYEANEHGWLASREPRLRSDDTSVGPAIDNTPRITSRCGRPTGHPRRAQQRPSRTRRSGVAGARPPANSSDRWECEGDACSALGAVLGPDCPAVRLDEAAGNRESEPGAAAGAGLV